MHKSCICTPLGSSLLGSSNIAKPVLFVGQGFVKKGRDGESEVVPFSGWKLGSALGIEALNLEVEAAFHAKVSGTVEIMLDLVAMIPLIPGQVMELDEESFGPPLAGFPAALAVVVALLELSPGGRKQSF